jgi:drug/metabolite transporter (DMT)-like permease
MKRAYFKYLLSLLLFGSNGVVASRIGLTSYEIVLLRSLLGSLLLIAIFFFSRYKLTVLRHKRDTIYIAISGLAMAANWLFLFEAFTQIGVSMGMLINYSGPAIVMALSPLVFKERVTWPKIIALLAALLGVFLISGQAVKEGVNAWGLLCAGLSAVAYAAMVIFNKMSKKITGMENSTLQLFFTFVTVAVFVGFKQGFYMEIAAGDWLPILWIGLLNTGVGCYLYFSSIGKLPVQTVAICGYLEPLAAVVFSVLFLSETMLPIQIFGALLILGGAVFAERTRSGKPLKKRT